MRITPVKTHKITGKDTSIFAVLNAALPALKEGTVVAVTSKIVSICEGRIVKNNQDSPAFKNEIIAKEADWYLPRSSRKYNVMLTIKGGAMNFSSGVDESNGNGYLILWPKDPQKSANLIREYLAKKFKLKRIGVVITDTASVPLRWGQRGVFVLSHSGFSALHSYIGKPDIFGRKLKMTSASISDALGTAAVLVMGEGAEQTPIALIEDVPFVRFQGRNPTQQELKKLRMPLNDDLYAPLLKAVKWRKGGGGYKKRVVVFGTFDGIHAGHRDFLRQARSFGDELVVLVAPDSVVQKLKGKTPRRKEEERRTLVLQQPFVDSAFLGDKKLSSYGALRKLAPNVVCVGYDQNALFYDLRKWIKRGKRSIDLIRLKSHRPEKYHNSLTNFPPRT